MYRKAPYCIFSFGGGVQSSAIYLMLIHEPQRLFDVMGELPDKIFFADTGAETRSTYECLKYMQDLRSPLFQIEIVNNGSILKSNFADAGNTKASYPFFIKNGMTGKVGMAKRICTNEYKIKAVQKATRRELRLSKIKLQPGTISMWLGISTDEAGRMRDSKDKWITNRYPLIELGIDRQACMEYCSKYNWIPTKSRCYMCPYQSNSNWKALKLNSPDEFELACKEDERIRERFLADGSKAFLHQSCIPLRDIRFDDDNTDGFGNDCQGMCGV